MHGLRYELSIFEYLAMSTETPHMCGLNRTNVSIAKFEEKKRREHFSGF